MIISISRQWHFHWIKRLRIHCNKLCACGGPKLVITLWKILSISHIICWSQLTAYMHKVFYSLRDFYSLRHTYLLTNYYKDTLIWMMVEYNAPKRPTWKCESSMQLRQKIIEKQNASCVLCYSLVYCKCVLWFQTTFRESFYLA